MRFSPRRSDVTRLPLAGILAASLLCVPLLLAAPASAADEPVSTVVEVDNARFRWGINDESNNAAFAPGTSNFFSAGKIGDPGAGGQQLSNTTSGSTWGNGKAAGWTAEAGNVSIQKWNGTAYKPATWAGRRTDSRGAVISSPSSGRFSNHTIVIDGGTGTVDAEEKSATIAWKGDFTVLYYSGMSFFHVSDPVLTVKDGVGTVTATLGGYETSMDDMTKWQQVEPRSATIADLGPVDLSHPRALGNMLPAYKGVTVSGVDQVDGTNKGSFPQSFIDFQQVVGTAAYWYSSGGAADAHKTALPLAVSLDADDAVTPTPPPVTEGNKPVTNEVVEPPAVDDPDDDTATPAAAAPNVTPAPAAANLVPSAATASPAAALSAASTGFQQVSAPVTLVAAEPVTTDRSAAAWWWLGAALLTLAAASVAGTFAYSAASPRR